MYMYYLYMYLGLGVYKIWVLWVSGSSVVVIAWCGQTFMIYYFQNEIQ